MKEELYEKLVENLKIQISNYQLLCQNLESQIEIKDKIIEAQDGYIEGINKIIEQPVQEDSPQSEQKDPPSQ